MEEDLAPFVHYALLEEESLHRYVDLLESINSGEDDDVVVIGSGVSNQPVNVLPEFEENLDKVKRSKPLESNGTFETVSQDNVRIQFELDELRCPICMVAWASSGEHQISCLPCGHIFGLSCLNKWIRHKRSSAKCPQCNKKCTQKDVRKLFAPGVAINDEESRKKIQLLEDKCASLERKELEWRKSESQLKETNSMLLSQLDSSEESARNWERIIESYEKVNRQIRNPSEVSTSSSVQYHLKAELEMENARIFDINASNHLLVARRATKRSAEHVLTKISLLSPSQREDIPLPTGMKFLKDLRYSRNDHRIVLCASLGKRFILLDTERKSVVLSYNLPAAAWSCCWDLNDPNYVYAGLQNGGVMAFDVRQSIGAMGYCGGLSIAPIHSLHSLHGSKSVIFGTSFGFGEWSSDNNDKKVRWIQEASQEEVCISLACSANDIVATFRPRVEFTGDYNLSQPVSTPPVNHWSQGYHRHYRRREGVYEKLGGVHAAVSDVLLPRSVLTENRLPAFVSSEATRGLVLRNLSCFGVVQRLKPNPSYVSDVRCNKVLLGSLSKEMLQIYQPCYL